MVHSCRQQKSSHSQCPWPSSHFPTLYQRGRKYENIFIYIRLWFDVPCDVLSSSYNASSPWLRSFHITRETCALVFVCFLNKQLMRANYIPEDKMDLQVALDWCWHFHFCPEFPNFWKWPDIARRLFWQKEIHIFGQKNHLCIGERAHNIWKSSWKWPRCSGTSEKYFFPGFYALAWLRGKNLTALMKFT